MAYLMEISFDNSCRLALNQYLFEYHGVRFKLVQDKTRKWADHLLTVVPMGDTAAQDRAFAAACEFVSALGWELHARVAVWESGGGGWPDDLPLSKAKPNIFVFPHVPFAGNLVNCHLRRLPHVKTNEQRVALALFREATSSNSVYLSFLFYWQILEVGGDDHDPASFVDETLREQPLGFYVDPAHLAELPLGSRSLGEYLSDDCRHAIAHIRRWPGKKVLDLDRRDERSRLVGSVRVIKTFAEYFVRERLGLKDYVYLVRLRRKGFPIFLDSQTIAECETWRAYAEPDLHPMFRMALNRLLTNRF